MAGMSAAAPLVDERAKLIQGRQPDSILEWRVALALYKAKWGFLYQEQSNLGGKVYYN